MLYKSIERYQNLVKEGIEKFTGWKDPFLAELICTIAILFTIFFTLIMVLEILNKLSHKDNVQKSQNSTLEGDTEKLEPYKPITIPFYYYGIFALIFFVIAQTCSNDKDDYELYSDELYETFTELKSTVFDTYLSTYTGDVLRPKESVAPSRIEKDRLYLTSFIVDGVHYNDSSIYVTYSDKFPSDTLIPFDASFVTDLLPTKEQRVKMKEDPSLFGYSGELATINKFGFVIRAIPLMDDYKVSLYHYLDDIDYIYNIKIENKTENNNQSRGITEKH